ncbi:5-formyltetrahydrofolate cyclo-ligase [Propylenella binzhouense]|uniref:5-formyltetrahydrofolate cyclo-ligase n=1 Tax=Propylenella binzhouense TaxID=2555902 RepID=A0A964T592_9HYPH|nr:5-formyltetrahydrofolate cyclo-ligase [Propylenella binzhouense]MYZ48137.1 5-formyltetrahydrofolate cyclo-ligase [Propylenella binzhouense]
MHGGAALKSELRRGALARRAAITPDEHQRWSWAAVDHIRPLVGEGEAVALFAPMRGEIDPLGLIATIRARRGEVLMPAVVAGTLIFRRFDGETLEAGPLGTRHPPVAEPELVPGLIVVPLAAFDRRGGRIGYGGGYYDRAIERLNAGAALVRTVGIGFACQEVDSVPLEPHDAVLDAVATEKELIRVKDHA